MQLSLGSMGRKEPEPAWNREEQRRGKGQGIDDRLLNFILMQFYPTLQLLRVISLLVLPISGLVCLRRILTPCPIRFSPVFPISL